jgi:uncharacterized repeat protein (TIGR01451 family)
MRNRFMLLTVAVALLAASAALLPLSALAAPTVAIASDNLGSYSGSAVPRYEKYEATLQISGAGTAFTDYNPFNPNLSSLGSQYYNKKGILVDAIITTPSGATQEWPCFWYQASDGSTSWRMRYTPTAVGTWRYCIRVKYGADTVNSVSRTFNCVAGPQHGFVQINPNDRRFFRYSDGTSYYPIGTDISGYSGTGGAAATAFPRMKANGANMTRVFFTSYNIEPYDTAKNGSVKSLNNYNMTRALTIDSLMDTAHANDVRIVWCLDDWTYIKATANQYIALSGREAPCTDVNGFYSSSTAKEIYKRKLRYWMARWGYSTNFLGFDFVNETGSAGGLSNGWHVEMGSYVHSFTQQPHLASGDNGSGELRTSGGIPNNDPSMDFSQYHDYAKYSQGWTIKGEGFNLEKMGCTLDYPWEDMAVYADRLARLQWRRYKWMKPLSWNEFGLIYRYPGVTNNFPDWNDAYAADPDARHYRDAMWAGMFAGLSVCHWKLDYVMGIKSYVNGGEKMWVFKPLANYLAGEEFVGLTQETTYPVADDTNPSPKVTCSNAKIMVVSMHGPSSAYFFAKNLTDVWARFVPGWGYPGSTCAAPPTPSSQSGTVKVGGLTSGTYTMTRWSTTDTNPATQVKETLSINVGTDGWATVPVSIGASDVGFAYKLEKSGGTLPPPPPPPVSGAPAITLTLSSDKTSAKPGDTVTYTITFKNTGSDTASGVAMETVLPANCTYVSASATSAGAYDSVTRKVKWTVSSIVAGATGTLQFKVTVD